MENKKFRRLLATFFATIFLLTAVACSPQDTTPIGETTGKGAIEGNTPPNGNPPGGGSTSVETGSGAKTLSNNEKIDDGVFESTNNDENAIRAEGAITATLNNATIAKTGGTASSNDASSFYGLNAAVLALDGATLNITGGSITATADGANGVFAYDNATININDTTIDVSGGNAGGIEVAGGGNIYANNLTVTSDNKAAIRSDRGGGNLVVDGGTYTTTGSSGAPAIYSTAEITAKNANLTAEKSEAVVIEGLNSVTLENCTVTGNMTGMTGNSTENIHNVMLYQSMSGDAKVGNSTFTMTGGTLTAKLGDMFYVTNTECVINLSAVVMNLSSSNSLLRVAGNDVSRGWGTAGANGGICTLNVSAQTFTGDINVDDISTLVMSMTDESIFYGSINSEGTAAKSLSVTLDASSTWTLSGNSYITAFDGNLSNVNLNGYALYINGVATK